MQSQRWRSCCSARRRVGPRPAVPAALLAGLQGATGRYEGAAIVATLLRSRNDRTSLINVRLRTPPVDSLSERERAVAREFAEGRTYKEIAAAFGTSPATVRSQIQSAYGKLGVSTKIELGNELADRPILHCSIPPAPCPWLNSRACGNALGFVGASRSRAAGAGMRRRRSEEWRVAGRRRIIGRTGGARPMAARPRAATTADRCCRLISGESC